MNEISKNLFTILAVTPDGHQITQQIIGKDGAWQDACCRFLGYMSEITDSGGFPVEDALKWTWQDNPLFKIKSVEHGEALKFMAPDACEMEMHEAMVVNLMACKVHFLAKSKGWHPDDEEDHTYIPKACANMHGEISELWEAYRRGELEKPCDKALDVTDHPTLGNNPMAKRCALTCEEEELADVIIRALDYAKRRKVNIGRAIALKHKFNGTRPERHGGKRA